MIIPRMLGNVLLGIWLILVGAAAFIDLGDLRKIIDILAIAAGVVILLSR